MKVKDVMNAKSVKWCSPETKLYDAAKTMSTISIGALLVVDKEKKVVGLITNRDVCLSLSQKQTASLAKLTVGQIMPKKVYTIKTSDDVSIAYNQMKVNKVGHLPVVDSYGKLKGIISLQNLSKKPFESDKEFNVNSAPGESFLKTIQAINNLYDSKSVSILKSVSTIKKPKLDKKSTGF